MLYLEDYLEMIEHLPAELRDRFTEMREMDLSVQNRVDTLEEKQKSFFAACKRLKPLDRVDEYEKIKREYKKVIEESSEKIQIAEDSYNLVDKYLRKLDQELEKFKLELEADNRGITEILEKRSLEMDAPSSSSLAGASSSSAALALTAKENRQPKKQASRKHQTIAHASGSASPSLSLNPGRKLPSSLLSGDLSLDATSGSPSLLAPSPGPSATYPLQHMGPGGNAIAAAASQAIAATQQLVPGRRTSSLKASYEAINLGLQNEFSIGSELAGAAQSALAATPLEGGGGPPNKRSKSNKRMAQSDMQSMLDVEMDDSLLGGDTGTDAGLLGTGDEPDWNIDPSEPTYCICNQVSYGDMVACDNDECPYEWFHYPCVGITAPPKGKWYCPTCLARRKGNRK